MHSGNIDRFCDSMSTIPILPMNLAFNFVAADAGNGVMNYDIRLHGKMAAVVTAWIIFLKRPNRVTMGALPSIILRGHYSG